MGYLGPSSIRIKILVCFMLDLSSETFLSLPWRSLKLALLELKDRSHRRNLEEPSPFFFLLTAFYKLDFSLALMWLWKKLGLATSSVTDCISWDWHCKPLLPLSSSSPFLPVSKSQVGMQKRVRSSQGHGSTLLLTMIWPVELAGYGGR